MGLSLTYHLTLLVLKLKGFKKIFSEDPINYQKLRKEDVYQPKGQFFKKYISEHLTVAKSKVTVVTQNKASTKLLLFVHGGAFISGPAKHHWDTVKELAQNTDHTIWFCDYPKAPETKINQISKNIDSIYEAALNEYNADQITLLGDSVGGTLLTALTQRLVKGKLPLPKKIILISPVMDATMTNSNITNIEPLDPMIAKKGLVSAKKMCAENGDLTHEMISPLNGSFKYFPTTVLFMAKHDITYPDQALAAQKLEHAKINLHVFKGESMPHIWPLLPVMKEAKIALRQIINHMNA